MANDYPSKQELSKIRHWQYTGEKSIQEWFDYIGSLWHWDLHYFRKWGRKYRLSTGGWSGNEDIITAMGKNTTMWLITWQESRRGGHYVFEIPTIKKDEK